MRKPPKKYFDTTGQTKSTGSTQKRVRFDMGVRQSNKNLKRLKGGNRGKKSKNLEKNWENSKWKKFGKIPPENREIAL